MKKFKKLIPAFCLLLVSAVLMGTSTFAWFSMNKTVKATGMTITAKSDSVFLVINEGSTFTKGGTAKEVTSTAAEKELYPVMPKNSFTNASTATDVSTATNWQFAYSDDINKSKSPDSLTYYACTAENWGNYVASETFSIGLNENSSLDTSDNEIKIKSITLPTDTGIKVIVVCGEKVALAAGDSLGVKATKTGVVVTVYYYIDGEDENVYTTNTDALTGTVVIEFTVE